MNYLHIVPLELKGNILSDISDKTDIRMYLELFDVSDVKNIVSMYLLCKYQNKDILKDYNSINQRNDRDIDFHILYLLMLDRYYTDIYTMERNIIDHTKFILKVLTDFLAFINKEIVEKSSHLDIFALDNPKLNLNKLPGFNMVILVSELMMMRVFPDIYILLVAEIKDVNWFLFYRAILISFSVKTIDLHVIRITKLEDLHKLNTKFYELKSSHLLEILNFVGAAYPHPSLYKCLNTHYNL